MFGGREDVGKSEKEHYAHLFFCHSKTRQYGICMDQIMESLNILFSCHNIRCNF